MEERSGDERVRDALASSTTPLVRYPRIVEVLPAGFCTDVNVVLSAANQELEHSGWKQGKTRVPHLR
jgi:hypothetical protein